MRVRIRCELHAPRGGQSGAIDSALPAVLSRTGARCVASDGICGNGPRHTHPSSGAVREGRLQTASAH